MIKWPKVENEASIFHISITRSTQSVPIITNLFLYSTAYKLTNIINILFSFHNCWEIISF